MHKQQGFTITELLVALIVVLGAGGWIANVYKLASMSFDPITGLLVIRAVGLFMVPLGSVMGFIPN